MIILAIATVAAPSSIALFEDETLLALQLGPWPGEHLMQQIDDLLRAQKLSYKKISVFAAAHGPGAFAGLRTGLTTAKTLAQTTAKKLMTVDALEAIAIQHEPSSSALLVVQKACRNEYNVGLFGTNPLHRLIPNTVATDDRIVELLLETEGDVTLSGDGAGIIYPMLLSKNKKTRVCLTAPASAIGTARGVGLLAYRLARHRQFSDPLKVKPVYSHAPNIKLSKNIDYEKLRAEAR